MRRERYGYFAKELKNVCLAGLLTLSQCATAVLPVMAAPADAAVQAVGQNVTGVSGYVLSPDETGLIPSYVSDIFDAEFYKKQYPDVAAAIGDDEQALLQHFLLFGLAEGRTGSPILDIARYRSHYPDLAALFDDNWDLYVQHYFRYGIAEGRSSGTLAKTSDTGSGSGAVYITKEGSSYDDKGNVLIPWEVITEGYLTLEALRERCGDTLVLLQDKDGKVNFVGGNFSDVKVTDVDSARESLHCMMKLLNFPEDTAELYLTHVNKDSKGDIYYRFSAQEKETGYLYADTDIIVGANQSGKVLCLSSSSGTRYYNTELSEKTVNWDGITARKAAAGWTLCPGESVLKYDAVLNQFVRVQYYEKDGIVCEYRVAVSTDSSYNMDEECYYQGMPTAGSYSYDFYFKNDISTVEWTVRDYYGNEVKLPMAYDQGKGYYLLDKKRKIVGIDCSDSLTPCYFQNQEELAKYYISAVSNIQSVWDTYHELGLFDEEAPTPILFRQNVLPFYQASCGYDCGVLDVEIYSEKSVATYDTIAHELAHGVLAMITGNLAYQNATGAINESYADILGNLLEMIAVGNGSNLGRTTDWLYAEGVTGAALRDMKVPGNMGQPDRVGGEYFEMDTNDRYAALNDNGGVHENSGILNRICYRMYAEAGIPQKELFLLWYDTLQQLNEDTDYGSIRRYMEYALRRHGLENKIDTVNRFFDDARVDSYVSGTTWKEMEAAEGASKVILNFRNMPQNISISAFQVAPATGYKVYIDNDSAGTPGVLMKEGSKLEKIYLCPVENNRNMFAMGVLGTLKDPEIKEDDRELVIDYHDVLAAEFTSNNQALADRYQADFMEVTFALKDTSTGNVSGWSIVLKRPDTTVDVTFDINVTASQAIPADPAGEPDGVTSPRRAVLRQDSEYAYTITLTDTDGAVWKKDTRLNTAEMELEESRTVTITFVEEGDNWVRQTTTAAASLLSEEEESNNVPGDEAADQQAAAVRPEGDMGTVGSTGEDAEETSGEGRENALERASGEGREDALERASGEGREDALERAVDGNGSSGSEDSTDGSANETDGNVDSESSASGVNSDTGSSDSSESNGSENNDNEDDSDASCSGDSADDSGSSDSNSDSSDSTGSSDSSVDEE